MEPTCVCPDCDGDGLVDWSGFGDLGFCELCEGVGSIARMPESNPPLPVTKEA